MEKTQIAPGRTKHRNDHGLAFRINTGMPLALSYLTAGEFEVHKTIHKGRIMGAVAFGTQRPRITAPNYPYAWVDMPALNDRSMFEVWTSAQPAVRDDADELVSARNENILFGCLQTKLDSRLDAASYDAYSRIFDFIDSRGYDHLLRVWNYIPQINADAEGLERYMRFNVGRHEAFAAKRRLIETDTPAACALGGRGTSLIIYFLASKQRGRLVENPRQTSAFHYPAQYGPRSPTFARATLLQTAGKAMLFVSGTASIVGHETLHIGNASAQARETVANILAVVAQAQRAGFDAPNSNANLMLKIYLRNPNDLSMVRNCLIEAFGPAVNALYLQADICRSNLLLEIEAVYSSASPPMH